MIGIRDILIFVGWVACLGAAYVATSKVSSDITYLPAFLAWITFIFASLTLLAMAFLSIGRRRRIYIGMSVFAIGSIVLFYHADMNIGRTPGSIFADTFLYTTSPYVAPTRIAGTIGNGSSSMNVESQPTDEQIANRENWESQSESVGYIIDLLVASCMTFFGAYLGAVTKSNETQIAR